MSCTEGSSNIPHQHNHLEKHSEKKGPEAEIWDHEYLRGQDSEKIVSEGQVRKVEEKKWAVGREVVRKL